MARTPATPTYGSGFYPARDFEHLGDLLDYLATVRPDSVPQRVQDDVRVCRDAGAPEDQQLRAAINATAVRRKELLAELDAIDQTLTRVIVERATDPSKGAGMTQLELSRALQLSSREITTYRFDPLELPPPSN